MTMRAAGSALQKREAGGAADCQGAAVTALGIGAARLRILLLLLPLLVVLSACSVSVERLASLGDLKVTEQGFLFSFGRTEYRHFAMADNESFTVLRATYAVYDIRRDAAMPHRAEPVIQQDATAWMNYLAETAGVVADLSRKLVQPTNFGYQGPELLIPMAKYRAVIGFGAAGFLYLSGESWAPNFVSAGGASCELQLTALAGRKVHYLLSEDGRYIAAVQSLDEIPYGQPKTAVTIEVFDGCNAVATHQLLIEVRDRVEALCVQDGEFWYSVKHDELPRRGAYTAFRHGSTERYESAADMDASYWLSSHSFDCKEKQFVWLQPSLVWDAGSLQEPVKIEIHYYQPATGKRGSSNVTLMPGR